METTILYLSEMNHREDQLTSFKVTRGKLGFKLSLHIGLFSQTVLNDCI